MFHGSMVAIVTPMHQGGAIDFDSLSRLIDFHLTSGTDAIVVAGTTGESAGFTLNEYRQVVRYVVRLVSGKKPVIVGSGTSSTAKSIDLTQEAMKLGADACLLMAPAYVKPTQEGLYQHYRAIAQNVAIPQILYNVPGRTACDILPETVARLAELPNIIGIKEATGELARAEAILRLCGESMDVYSGDDPMTKDIILAGGKGVISVTANVAPRQMQQMCLAAMQGDRAKANALDAPLVGLHKNLFIQSNPIPVKWALQQMGLIEEGIRLPLTPLSKELQSSVENALKEAGVLTECV